MRVSSLLVLGGLAIVLSAARASAVTEGDVEVELLDGPDGMAWHGYIEHRFRLCNHSPDSRREVEIELPARSSPHHREGTTSLRRTVVIAPGSSATVSLFQPHLALAGPGASVTVDGRTWRTPLRHLPSAMRVVTRGWDRDDVRPVSYTHLTLPTN